MAGHPPPGRTPRKETTDSAGNAKRQKVLRKQMLRMMMKGAMRIMLMLKVEEIVETLKATMTAAGLIHRTCPLPHQHQANRIQLVTTVHEIIDLD